MRRLVELLDGESSACRAVFLVVCRVVRLTGGKMRVFQHYASCHPTSLFCCCMLLVMASIDFCCIIEDKRKHSMVWASLINHSRSDSPPHQVG